MDIATTPQQVTVEELHGALVRSALASHLAAPLESLLDAHELENDLGLDPLDLVLIILRLEETFGFEFPVARLEGARTVGDIIGLVRRWLGARDPH